MSRIEPFRSYWREEVVLYRGDDIIDSGTIQEIADRRGVLKSTIRWYLTGAGFRRAERRKDQRKAIRVVRVG